MMAEGPGQTKIPLAKISGSGQLYSPLAGKVADAFAHAPLHQRDECRIGDIADLDLDHAADHDENLSPLDTGRHAAPETFDTPRRDRNREAVPFLDLFGSALHRLLHRAADFPRILPGAAAA
jgi:hypothetical protein